MSGCGRDVQAESLELADVVADLALPVDVGVVVAGSEVAEPGFGVGEQVEDDDQDGAGDGGDGVALAVAAGQAAVAFAGEGAGPAGGGGDLAEDAVEVGVALAGLRAGGLRAGLAGLRQRLARDTSRPGVPNTAMSWPISAMIAWAAMTPQPVISSSLITAGSTGAPGPLPGPVVPSAPVPCAAGVAAISSVMRAVSWSIWPVRASIWSSRMRASSPCWSSNRPGRTGSCGRHGGHCRPRPAAGPAAGRPARCRPLSSPGTPPARSARPPGHRRARGTGSRPASKRNAASTARWASMESNLPFPRRCLRLGCSHSSTSSCGEPGAVVADPHHRDRLARRIGDLHLVGIAVGAGPDDRVYYLCQHGHAA